MGQPSPGDVYVDRILTDVLVAWMQDQKGFVSSNVFPSVPVDLQSSVYFQYARDDWYRTVAQKRGPGAESAGSGYTLSTGRYSADVWAVHKDVDDQTRANTVPPLNPDRSATEWVGAQIMLRRELQWANQFFKTGLWTGDQTGVAAAPGANQFLKWGSAGATPVEDIDNQMLAIEQRTGYKPNKLVLGRSTFTTLKNNPEILDRVKYTQRGVITEELMADVFGVDQVLVARAVQNLAVEGAVLNNTFALDAKSALLAYAAPAPSIDQPSAGYTFSWSGYTGAVEGVRIKNFRIEKIESNRVEGTAAFDMHIVAPDLGAFFTAAVA